MHEKKRIKTELIQLLIFLLFFFGGLTVLRPTNNSTLSLLSSSPNIQGRLNDISDDETFLIPTPTFNAIQKKWQIKVNENLTSPARLFQFQSAANFSIKQNLDDGIFETVTPTLLPNGEYQFNFPVSHLPQSPFTWALYLLAVSICSGIIFLFNSVFLFLFRSKTKGAKFCALFPPACFLLVLILQYPGLINPYNPISWLQFVAQRVAFPQDSYVLPILTTAIQYYFHCFFFQYIWIGLFFTTAMMGISFLMCKNSWSYWALLPFVLVTYFSPASFSSFGFLERNVVVNWIYVLIFIFSYFILQKKELPTTGRQVLNFLFLTTAWIRVDLAPFLFIFSAIYWIYDKKISRQTFFCVFMSLLVHQIVLDPMVSHHWRQKYFLISTVETIRDIYSQDAPGPEFKSEEKKLDQFLDIQKIKTAQQKDFNVFEFIRKPEPGADFSFVLPIYWDLIRQHPRAFLQSRFHIFLSSFTNLFQWDVQNPGISKNLQQFVYEMDGSRSQTPSRGLFTYRIQLSSFYANYHLGLVTLYILIFFGIILFLENPTMGLLFLVWISRSLVNFFFAPDSSWIYYTYLHALLGFAIAFIIQYLISKVSHHRSSRCEKYPKFVSWFGAFLR